MIIYSIIITVALYILMGYLSFITASILYNGLRFKLPLSVLRSIVFIGISYISIISDVILFGYAMYSSVLIKNGMLFLLVVSTLVPAVDGKESHYEHKGE